MVLSHENRYDLVVAGMLAGRQPKVSLLSVILNIYISLDTQNDKYF